jgi:poly-beta-hydroxybutyrate-responsive repressor
MLHSVDNDAMTVSGAEGQPDPAAPRTRLHGDLLTSTLLAFLKASNAYGYELTQRLAEAGLPPFDTGAVYRTLRQMEATGLVSSFWDTSESGPARRMYSLTQAGEIFLASWLQVMANYQAVLEQALGMAKQGWTSEPGEASRR